jgi:hypothetical protein
MWGPLAMCSSSLASRSSAHRMRAESLERSYRVDKLLVVQALGSTPDDEPQG